MSDDYTGGDGGTEYGHYEAGQESNALNELHTDQSAVAEHDSQFGVYEQDHHAAENTEFTKAHHEEVSTPYVHAESTDYVDYSHSSEVDDHVFAAQGSEHSLEAQSSSLDALEARFDAAFAQGTVLETGTAGAAELGPATS
jgi:phage I-like protein